MLGIGGGRYPQRLGERVAAGRISAARHPVLSLEKLRPDLRALLEIP